MKKIFLHFKDVLVMMEVKVLQRARIPDRIIHAADKKLGKSNY